MAQDKIETKYHHGHGPDRAVLVGENTCCGCWNLVYDEDGLYAECNECGERRELPESMAFSP